jgi:hypothetical protein
VPAIVNQFDERCSLEMETVKVGIREFRDKLATYVSESDAAFLKMSLWTAPRNGRHKRIDD